MADSDRTQRILRLLQWGALDTPSGIPLIQAVLADVEAAVAAAKPAPRVTAVDTTLSAADVGGIVATAACTITVDTAANLGEGFTVAVWADGGLVTLAGLSASVSIPSGQFVIISVAHGKRWPSGPNSPAVTPS